jgi:hypothetical protein
MAWLAVLQKEDGSLWRLLLLALIFFGPAVGRLIQKAVGKSNSASGGAPRPSAPPAPPREGGLSWEDLLRGEVPAPEPAESPDLRERLEPLPTFLEEHAEHDDEYLSPSEVLGDLPLESELEIHGGDRGRPLLPVTGMPAAERPADGRSGQHRGGAWTVPRESEGEIFGKFRGLHEVTPTPAAAAAAAAAVAAADQVDRRGAPSALTTRLPSSEWRRAIVLHELLGPPLALRRGDDRPSS